jgi:protein-disulfide isomerase
MGKREIVKRNRKKTSSNLTLIFIIAAFAVVAVGMIIITTYKPKAKVVIPENTTAQVRDGLSMGNPDASVKVVEFADFQCPACASYWSSLEPYIIENYIDTGKVYFTYSPFSFLGQGTQWDESKKSAEAAYCANDQQKFWEFHDLIFANHNGENGGVYTQDFLTAFAEELNLDVNTFTECLTSGKYTAQIETDNEFAQTSGATYTPSFLVNGQVINANDLITTIDSLINQ